MCCQRVKTDGFFIGCCDVDYVIGITRGIYLEINKQWRLAKHSECIELPNKDWLLITNYKDSFKDAEKFIIKYYKILRKFKKVVIDKKINLTQDLAFEKNKNMYIRMKEDLDIQLGNGMKVAVMKKYNKEKFYKDRIKNIGE